MNDRVLLIAASAVSCIGLALLFFAATPQQNEFVLTGTVHHVERTRAVIEVNVTVLGKNITAGTFSKPVFWGGESFIVVPE